VTAPTQDRAAELGMTTAEYTIFRRAAEGYAAATGLLLTEGGIRWAENDLLKLLHALDVIGQEAARAGDLLNHTGDALVGSDRAKTHTSRLWAAYRAKTRHRHHRSHR
jgi:hypothetical protein